MVGVAPLVLDDDEDEECPHESSVSSQPSSPEDPELEELEELEELDEVELLREHESSESGVSHPESLTLPSSVGSLSSGTSSRVVVVDPPQPSLLSS